jgi:protein ImuB
MPTRIACLYIPDFALAARLRSEPSLKDQPLALVDGKGSHAVVIAAVATVMNAGIRSGFSLPQTRALLPSVAFKQRDLEAERAAQAALVETAEAFSPRVEESGPGLVYLDMCNEKSESMLLELAVRRARLAGLRAQAGVAGGKLAAHVAAEEARGGPVVVPLGEEGAFLAPLPVARLRSDEKILETFERWGLKSIGAFAALPEREVMARLGKEGWDLHRAARGIDPRPLVARAHPTDYTEGIELEWPVPDWQAFEQVARGLLERLMVRLAAAGLAARALRLSLTIDPVGVDARLVPLPAPSRDVTSMLSLLAIELERTPVSGPIIGITFTADPEKPARAQLALFDPPALSPDALGATLARLAALVGPERFGSPRSVDGHRPESFSLEAFNPSLAPENHSLFGNPPEIGQGPGTTNDVAVAGRSNAIAVRVLRPRIDIEVGMSREEVGKPAFVRTRANDGSSAEIVGAVRVASGPWRIEDGWWLGEPLLRDYWDIELSDGALYRIYHDPIKDHWWADGIYD